MPRATKVQGSNVKKEKKPRVKKVKEPKEKKLSAVAMIKIKVALDKFKDQLVSYRRYKENGEWKELHYLCSFERSPIWDITKGGFFKLDFISEEAMKGVEKCTDEHLYNRTFSSYVIFDKVDKNIEMTVEEFIEILKIYGVTIKITESEHNRLPKSTRGNCEKTYEDYENIGIIIPGLKEYMENERLKKQK